MQFIASATGSGSVTFSSIPSQFTHLQIRMFARESITGTPQEMCIRFNSDSGNNYVFHRLVGDGSGANAASFTAKSYIETSLTSGASQSANIFGAAIVDVLDYANTNKNKVVRSIGGFDANGTGYVGLHSGVWFSTAAITSVWLFVGSGTSDANTRFDLYGITTSELTGA